LTTVVKVTVAHENEKLPLKTKAFGWSVLCSSQSGCCRLHSGTRGVECL